MKKEIVGYIDRYVYNRFGFYGDFSCTRSPKQQHAIIGTVWKIDDGIFSERPNLKVKVTIEVIES